MLGLGLLLGFKHATEADHVVAVSNIVSEHRKISKVALVGGLWGLGHTAMLLAVGIVVLLLRIAVPERVANILEFGVALMIIALSGTALARALRGRRDVHVHKHAHNGVEHVHLHFHEQGTQHDPTRPVSHDHSVHRLGWKPLLVGGMHGLAGSAALTLLVLTQVPSVFLGLMYLLVFGVGSIAGMMIVSTLIGLPFTLTARRLSRATAALEAVTGVAGLCFGCWYAARVWPGIF